MRHLEGSRFYEADEGMFIVRVSDGRIMGDCIRLGESDSADNYREEPYTEESRAEFFRSVGRKDIRKHRSEISDREAVVR